MNRTFVAAIFALLAVTKDGRGFSLRPRGQTAAVGIAVRNCTTPSARPLA
jgi:hypothetical protein